jgi:hypothetical protein
MPRTQPTQQHDAKRPLRLIVRHSGNERDAGLAQELLAHLRPLERFAGVNVWTDDGIVAGDLKGARIDEAIEQADVALLLLSADFLASDTLQDVEVPKLLKRHEAGSLRVIPVLLRSCAWEMHPWLAELHPLPKDRTPIASFAGDERDSVLTELAREIVQPATATRPPGKEKLKSVAIAAAGSKSPSEPTPASGGGGPTYNFHIHGSTIGAIGTGPGAHVTGSVNHNELAGTPTQAVRSLTLLR